MGIEVSEIIDNQDVLKSFKIAQVVDVKDHPNADRLKLCKINDGNKNRDKIKHGIKIKMIIQIK